MWIFSRLQMIFVGENVECRHWKIAYFQMVNRLRVVEINVLFIYINVLFIYINNFNF